MKKRATIRDVAEKAGVSIATVSFVLNKRAGEAISDKVKKRVAKAAEALDYHPSASARGLARKRTRNLTVVFYRDASTIANAFYSFVVQGIIKETTRHQYNLLFAFVDDEYGGAKDLPQPVREQNTEGVLVLHMTSAQMVRDIQALGIPVAAIDVHPHVGHTYAVETDNVQGAKLATNHLIDLGHRKLGFLVGSLERFSIAERERGFREALDAAKIRYSPDKMLFDCGQLDHCAAYARAKQLLARADRPTGIFCANDEVGAGALRAAYELGVRVPEQLSVIGFDDITMCNFTNPPLSTVGIDKEAMGSQAVMGLMQAIERKAETQVPLGPPARMGVQLVTRASTGPAPRARGKGRAGEREAGEE